MSLKILGLNHNTAPVEIRERIVFAGPEIPAALNEVRNLAGIEEAVLLSTCNRTEFYVVGNGEAHESLKGWLTATRRLDDGFHDSLFSLEEADAIRHIFRVACGLDSMVLGEPQILGQLKDEHRLVREAPFWLVLPQMIYVLFLMAFALVPGLALRHVDAYIGNFLPDGALSWEGFTITSEFGYWSPVSIMIIIGVIFMLLFAWLLFVNRKAQKVKQFNIVVAAERPYRPETTHYAWNFYAPYRKALGFLTWPLFERFWGSLVELLHTLADLLRRYYNGNGQVYAIQLLAFVVIVYLFTPGG